ncbi:MAG: hypothetical protein IJU98_02655, partial [Synergistaceae bacterium]|nr:hypothetical protein [Synergistaceae bacterium]
DRFDVIISDTSDKEEQMPLLEELKSMAPRVKVFQNASDTLPHANFRLALTSGDGVFVIHVNDRDSILPDRLSMFLDFLETNQDCAGGYCRDYGHEISDPTSCEPSRIFTKDPVCCYQPFHATGFVFNVRLNNGRKEIEAAFVPSFGYHHSILLGRLCMKEKVFFYGPQVWTRPSDDWYSKNPSGTSSKNTLIFFSPEGRLLQLKYYLKELDQFSVPEELRNRWRRELIKRETVRATVEYCYDCLTSESTMRHWAGRPAEKLSFYAKFRIISKTLKRFKEELGLDEAFYREVKREIQRNVLIRHFGKYVKYIPSGIKPVIKKLLKWKTEPCTRE